MSSKDAPTPNGGPPRSFPGTLPIPIPPPIPPRPNPEHSNWPPSIKILRAGTGIESVQPDERCFTYCSQSIAGRNKGDSPFCRSICFRRIYKHEVKQIIARSEDGKQRGVFMPESNHDDILAMFERLGVKVRLEEREIRQPLPPEGQRPSAFFAGRPRTGPLPPREEPERPLRAGPMSATEARKEARQDRKLDKGKDKDKAPSTEPKVWEEGTYVWYTQNTWHAIDHLAMMRAGIKTQAAWQRYQDRIRQDGPELAAKMSAQTRAQREREWMEAKREASHKLPEGNDEAVAQGDRSDAKSSPKERLGQGQPALRVPSHEYESITNARSGEWSPNQRGVPSFPDLEGSAILFPVAPEFPPIDRYVARALAPTGHVLDVFTRSWQNGVQQRFANKAWDKTFGTEWKEPWRLLGRVWDTLRKSGGEGK